MKRTLAVLMIAGAFASASIPAAEAGSLRDAARKIAQTSGVAVLAGAIVARCALIKLRPGPPRTC